MALFTGKVQHLSTSGTAEWWDRPWSTGFIKSPLQERCWLGYEGLRGDEQADRQHHGGVEKAVCTYPSEHYSYWKTELARPDFPWGAFGENVTTSGFTEDVIFIGDTFKLGEAIVQVSQPRQPCWKLARRWQIRDLTARVEGTGKTGFYFRVLLHGWVWPGAELELMDRLGTKWSIAECNRIMHHARDDIPATSELAQFSPLSASWKDSLWRRSQGQVVSREPRIKGTESL
jgi:MOSC domain-containing protein YiiM